MRIDESTIANGITVELLAELISKHEGRNQHFTKLRDYYMGKHAIENRRRENKSTANNKIICNHAKYIVDMGQSYLTGNPITYAASEEYDIEALKDTYSEQDISSLDSELVKHMNIYGRAYELIYADGEAKPKSVYLPSEQAFVVYAQSADKKPLFGVYYYKRYDIHGSCIGVVCNVYDSENTYTYESRQESYSSMELTETAAHYFGGVPLIEYQNNSERQGDFEQLIPLIDAYNLLCSDRVNDKEQFVNSFLFLSGVEVDSEQAKKLKEERILMGYEGSEAKYLSKVMQESDIKILRDDLKDDIHRFSMVPDLSDESFGNNLSGVAIKYKLLGFEQLIKNKERYFAKGLKERFRLYNNYLVLKNSMGIVPVHRIDVVFTYNLPANELEISQMIANLQNIVSSETLLDRIPFVSDAKEEAELVKAEQTDGYRRKIESISDVAEGGGY